MDVYLIWVRYGDGAIALHDAWDADTELDNPEGFRESLGEAERDCEPERGGAVRVVKTTVDLGAIEELFELPTVSNTGVSAVNADGPTKVVGNLFNETGKWKYEVSLDYSVVTAPDYRVSEQARQALAAATDAGTSGVKLREIPEGWYLVVQDGPAGFPVTAFGGAR